MAATSPRRSHVRQRMTTDTPVRGQPGPGLRPGRFSGARSWVHALPHLGTGRPDAAVRLWTRDGAHERGWCACRSAADTSRLHRRGAARGCARAGLRDRLQRHQRQAGAPTQVSSSAGRQTAGYSVIAQKWGICMPLSASRRSAQSLSARRRDGIDVGLIETRCRTSGW
jgi:hypothetical protein